MGQLNRLPQTNVLFFPGARVEEGSASQFGESQGGDYRPSVNDAQVELRAILDSLKSVHIVSSSGLRVLMIVLVLLAALPSLSMAAIWFGRTAISPSRSGDVSPAYGAEVTISFPVISIPAMLKATAGENMPFPVGVDGADPVEVDSTIAISRLPQGSTFSAGKPDGKTTWKLALGDIDNLHLLLPKTARDETTLLIQLLAADGRVISDAATIIEVTNVSETSILVRRIKTEVVPSPGWDQPSQEPEAMNAESEVITPTRATRSDPVPLPTRHPGRR